MSEPLSSRFGVPAAAAVAVGVAVYAWVGPMWFTGTPPLPSLGDVSAPEGAAGPGPLVGSVRSTDFSELTDALLAIRPPEQEAAAPADPEPNEADEEPAEDGPPEGSVLSSWRYAGYVGPPESLIAIITLPSGDQVSAVAGETVAATPRPTVDRVSRTEVVLRLAEERYTIVREGVERADETGADSADRGDGGPASTPNDASRGRSSPDRERTDEARLRRSGAARAVQRELSGDGDGQAGGEDR